MRRALVAAVLAGLAIVGPLGIRADAAPPPFTEKVHSFTYIPTDPSVPRGTQIYFRNLDPFTHTMTSDRLVNGSPLFTSGRTSPGAKNPVRHSSTLRPGTYGFHCQIHTDMHGTLYVNGVG